MSAYLKEQQAKQQAMLDVGMETGFQKCWDLVQLCLNDPDVVGKDTFARCELTGCLERCTGMNGNSAMPGPWRWIPT